MSLEVEIFGRAKALIGMVHVRALPGTPNHSEPMAAIVDRAAQEAAALRDAGFDGLILENMHDAPYLLREVGPEITASMTAVAVRVRAEVSGPVGVQILAGANRAALSVAHAAGLEFIRAEGFVFASVADEGLMGEADAGPLLRFRKSIGAEGVRVLADVKKKHSSHAITSDVSPGEMAQAAEMFGADGVVVTGLATGMPTSASDLEEVRSATGLPVVVGSGATPESLRDLYAHADAVIVGSWCKVDGDWRGELDPARMGALVEAARRLRGE